MNDSDKLHDSETTVNELREVVRQFVDERDWQPYHTPKNLVMSLSVEVAELMEHFQWRTPEEAAAIADDPELLKEVAREMADVLSYLLALSNSLGVDLSSSLHEKMNLNRIKYPAEASKGNWTVPKQQS